MCPPPRDGGFRSAMSSGLARSPRSRIRNRRRREQADDQAVPIRGRCPLRGDLPAWRDQVRRIADSGYSTLLMPDVPNGSRRQARRWPSQSTLADMRVGTWVYASPVRPAWTTAWEAHSLSVLTEGRFEMGIGIGRPGIEDQLRELGLPVVPHRASGLLRCVTPWRRCESSTAPTCTRRW